MARQELLVFTRYPEPGKTKTRLIPLLGLQGAAELHRQMTEATLKKVKVLKDVSVVICYTGTTVVSMKSWLGNGLDYREQCQGDLGERMYDALSASFTLVSDSHVVIIGTDCPDLSPAIINQAFQSLSSHDLVLGPALDGGYYLIGVRSAIAQLFQGIPWGTEKVFTQTQATAKALGLRVFELPLLRDIDRPEDLIL